MKGRYADGKMSYKFAKKALEAGLWVKRKVKGYYLFIDPATKKLMSSDGTPYTITKDDQLDEEWEMVTGIYEMTMGKLVEEWNYRPAAKVFKLLPIYKGKAI